MESIEELKKKCQRNRDFGKMSVILPYYNNVSIYMTKLLLYTPISANQTSMLSMLFGIIASILFIFINPTFYIIPVIFLHLWVLGDFCDGSIARYRGTADKSGIGSFFDWFGEHSVPPILFLLISLRYFFDSFSLIPLLLGILASLFWFILYFWPHVRNIIHMFSQNKKESLARIKKTISPTKYNIMLKIIGMLEALGLFKASKKYKIKYTPPEDYNYLRYHMQHFYFPTYLTVIAFLTLIFRYDFMYAFLITIGVLLPLIWIIDKFRNIG